MENDISQNLNGSLLPPFGRNSGFSLDTSNENANLEPTNGPATATESDHFSHDISQMPDTPPKYLGHRRAQSEIFTLPDDITFGSDLGVVGSFDGPSYSDETEEDMFSMYLEIDKCSSSSATSASQAVESSSSAVQTSKTAATQPLETHDQSSGDRPRIKHQHSLSMDGSTMLTSGSEDTASTDAKKSMSADKLAELALVDPKRAKRIWANRQSAARSKERKMRYIAELERNLQTLQTEATSLSTNLALLQRDTNGLVVENNELKLRVQTMEQQIHMQDALNDSLRKEIQHLKVLTGQNLPNGGPMMNFPPSFGPNPQFHPHQQNMRTMLTSQQFQQLQIQSRNLHPHIFQQQPQFPPFQPPPQQLRQLQPLQQPQLQQIHRPPLQQPPQQLPQSSDMKNRSSLST